MISAVKAAATLTPDYEVLVINDGSQDDTAHILDELARMYPDHVRIVHHAKNRGYGGALRIGVRARAKDLVFYTDGDAQYDPVRDDACSGPRSPTMWTGSTAGRSAAPIRCTGSSSAASITTPSRLLFGLKVRDVDCDFRLMRRRIFDVVQLEKNSGVICLEMMKKFQDAGFRVAEAPVHHYHRALRQVAVLQLPAHLRDRRRRDEAVVGAGRSGAST